MTDDVFAGLLKLLKVMVAVSDVGALAWKVTPSTLSVELLLISDEPRVEIVAVRFAATPAAVIGSLQSLLIACGPVTACGRALRLRFRSAFW